MTSHLSAILDRLNKLVEGGNPKETFNFERDGKIVATISFDPEEGLFSIKYPGQKETAPFDDIDLVAIEVFDLIY